MLHNLEEKQTLTFTENSSCAHSRNLCDTRGLGKLNTEQFALAMYLIQQKLKGIEPPQSLPADMIPPSMRQPVSVTKLALF